MIDRDARNRLAEAIRHFVAGFKDNFELDDSVWSIRTKDAGIVRIRQEMWYVYDDIRRHELKGEWALSEQQKENISRFILFLKSNVEYRWPQKHWEVPLARLLFGVFTFGLLPKYLDRKWKENGTWEVWPFLTASEFNEAKQKPVYLANATYHLAQPDSLRRRSAPRSSQVSSALEPIMEPGQEAPKLREIYAYLGYAMFLSQSLEGLLNQAIFAFVIFPAKKSEIREIAGRQALNEWKEFVDSPDERLRRKTLGTLLSKLRDEKILTPDIEQSLKDALFQRNYVAHQFFKDKLASLYSEKGQDEATLFLRRAGGTMKVAIDRLLPLINAEFERYGYDAAYVEEFARNEIRNATDGL